jgi:hypothetical protein
MFQKERLCYVLEKYISEKYTKILFLDCDIIFNNLNWYDDISNLLDTHNVVHPFTTAVWLDITYKNIYLRKDSILHNKLSSNSSNVWNYHSGFGWAFQRKWFNEIGFFQYCIIGGGDTCSTFGWLKLSYNGPSIFKSIIIEYNRFLKYNKPSIGYISGCIYHLYHGSRKNRQLGIRYNIIKNIENIQDILIIEENKPFEFKPEYSYLNEYIKEYLKNRDDDSI